MMPCPLKAGLMCDAAKHRDGTPCPGCVLFMIRNRAVRAKRLEVIKSDNRV